MPQSVACPQQEVDGTNLCLKATFHQRLNPEVLTELVCHDDEVSLNSLTDIALHLYLPGSPTSETNYLEPKSTRKFEPHRIQEVEERKPLLLLLQFKPLGFMEQCLACRKSSTSTSPAQRTPTAIHYATVSPLEFLSHQSFPLNVQIKHSDSVFVLQALIDPTGNSKDHKTFMKFNLPTKPLQHPIWISAMDRGHIWNGIILLCTEPLLLQVSISFQVTTTVKHPIIVQIPSDTTVNSPEVYHDFLDIFDKGILTEPRIVPINLPLKPQPHNHIYPLSLTHQAMEDQVQEDL